MHRFLSVKNKIVLILILSILFLFVSLYKSNEEIFVRTVNIICENDLVKKQIKRLEEKILHRLEESPTMAKGIFDTIWELSEKGEFTGDVRYISPIIHKAGMILAEEKKIF